ncbi:MAG: hypothetical protein DDT35_00233 [Firmicutes bacterium]|nr:hypothetical protein [Bacillota bacterium]
MTDKVGLVLSLGFMLVAGSACRFLGGPAEGMPGIPCIISKGENMEPVINVNMRETGQIRAMPMG